MSSSSPSGHVELDPLDDLWRAVSDSTRRGILDRLRERPQTTSDLAAAFPQSRFAVMKHLEVLVGVGLVVVRRQGRERWNHLNAAPLQQMYERWVRPYEAHWTSPMLRFKEAMEPSTQESSMSSHAKAPATQQAAVLHIELEIPIAAPAARIWDALTKDVSLWWPRDFFALAGGGTMRMVPKLGGHLYEERADGAGVTWYTIIAIEPGRSIDFVGHLTPRFGGPASTLLRLSLRAVDEGNTVLELTDGVYGRVTEKTGATLEEGWRALFAGGLKGYVEAQQQGEHKG